MKNHTRQSGFTLIELMIVLVIVGVLAAVAVPGYQSYVLKGHRNQAQILVQNLAQRQEEYYNMYQRYGSLAEMALAGLDTYLADKGEKLSEGAQVVSGRFAFSTSKITNDGFKFQLKAINAQLADKDCLFIRVDETSLFDQKGEGADSFCSST